MKIVLLNSCVFLIACASTEKEYDRQGNEYTIVCKHTVTQCYFKAQDRCLRNSYTVTNVSQTERTGGPQGRYREYTVKIKCG